MLSISEPTRGSQTLSGKCDDFAVSAGWWKSKGLIWISVRLDNVDKSKSWYPEYCRWCVLVRGGMGRTNGAGTLFMVTMTTTGLSRVTPLHTDDCEWESAERESWNHYKCISMIICSETNYVVRANAMDGIHQSLLDNSTCLKLNWTGTIQITVFLWYSISQCSILLDSIDSFQWKHITSSSIAFRVPFIDRD